MWPTTVKQSNLNAVKILKDGRECVDVDARSERPICHSNQKEKRKHSGNCWIVLNNLKRKGTHIVRTDQIPMGTVYEILTKTLDKGGFLIVEYLNCWLNEIQQYVI